MDSLFDDNEFDDIYEESKLEFEKSSFKNNEDLNDSHKRTNQIIRRNTIINGHLSSPILFSDVDFILSCDDKSIVCRRHKKIKSMLNNKIKEGYSLLSLRDKTNDCIGYIQDWIKNIYYDSNEERYNSIFYCLENWIIQKLENSTPLILGELITQDEVKEYCKTIINNIISEKSKIRTDFKNMIKAEYIKDKICFKEILLGTFINFRNELFCEGDLSFFENSKSKTIILFPTTILICSLDKIQSIFPLKLYWLLSDIFKAYPNQSIYENGCKLMDVFFELRSKMNQDFFKFMGCWESLVIGRIIMNDDDLKFEGLLKTQINDMTKLLNNNKIKNFNFNKILPKSEDDIESKMFLELIGMSKIFGYPILEANKLLDQIKEFGTKYTYNVDPELIDQIDGITKRNFILNYKSKNNHFPKLKNCPKELKDYMYNNKKLTNDIKRDYNLWHQVKFDKNFEYDFTPDQVELLKDSAVAPGYNSWASAYDACAFYHLYNKPPPSKFKKPPTKGTRTIESFLKSSNTTVEKIIRDRENNIYNTDDHMVQEVPKENELKGEGGRAFTKQTFNQRLFQTSLEYNLSKTIFKFVPEQSMTDGEILNSRRILSQVKNLERDTIFINIDMKKWCLHWRFETVQQIGEMYDDLFGLKNIYSNSHNIFVDCSVFSNCRLHPPDYDKSQNPIPGPSYLNNLIGGMEGMHQKKWTHISIGIFTFVLEKLNLDYTLMCQGDNVVVMIHTDKNSSNQLETKDAFLISLENTMSRMHHKLKFSETWYSIFLHEYSKNRYFKGSSVRGGTKKASKLIPDINDGLFSIQSCISTINTMTEGVSRFCNCPDIGFLLNQILISNFLIRKDIIRPQKRNLMMLTNTPIDFGGIPLSTLQNHSIRGHDDKIVVWISIWKTWEKYDNKFSKSLLNFWITSPTNPAIKSFERKKLYMDIYCLKIDSLPSAENEIKKYTEAFLKSDFVTNPVVTKLYKGKNSKSLEQLIDILDSMRPRFIQLSHELLMLSNAGLLMRLQQQFKQTKTIEKIVSNYESISLIELIQIKNDELISIVRSRMGSIHRQNRDLKLFQSEKCPSEIADELRLKSWGIQISNLTKASPSINTIIKNTDQCSEVEINRSIIIKTSKEAQLSYQLIIDKLGPYRPYIGSSTHEKIKKPTVDIVEKTSYSKALLGLCKIRSWMELVDSPNMIELVDMLIKEKLSIVCLPQDIESIEVISPEIVAGNINHRFISEMESSYAMVNCLPSFSSHFNQSSNLLQKSTGGEDMTIFFQLNFISNMMQLFNLSLIKGKLTPSYNSIFCCNYCCKKVEKSSYELKKKIKFNSEKLLQNRIIKIKNSIQLNFSKQLMELSLAILLSRNIDKNFELIHLHGCHNEKIKEHIKEKISINDLRLLNLKRIFDMTILLSSHCRRLILNTNDIVNALSYDQSFIYLAELICDSGLLQYFIFILNQKVTEHTMTSNYQKLSCHIGRSIPIYYYKNINTINKNFPTTSLSNWKYPIFNFLNFQISYYKEVNNPNMNKINLQHAYNILKRKNRKDAINILNLNDNKFFLIKTEDIITYWRIAKEQFDFNIENEDKDIISVRKNLNLNFKINFVTLTLYHDLRSEEEGVFMIKELSFCSRLIGEISSAATKYVEILCQTGFYDLIKESTLPIVSLAEGSGGTISTLLKIFPNSFGYYNTLIRPDIDFRENATDTFSPSLYSSFLAKDSILPGQKLFLMGETNILNPNFIDKFNLFCQTNKINILTIDAESLLNSNNFVFAETYIPILNNTKVNLGIIKLFYYNELDVQLAVFMLSYPNFQWFLYKPISSNPIGNEVMMVFTNNIPLNQEWISMNRLWNLKKRYLKVRSLMTEKSIMLYLDISQSLVNSFLNCDDFDVIRLPNRYQEYLNILGCCSLICNRFLMNIISLISKVHFNESDENIFPLIREGGTNETLRRLICDFSFLLISLRISTLNIRKNEKILKILLSFYNITMESNIEKYRKNISKGYGIFKFSINYTKGNFFDNWGDFKIYMRGLMEKPLLTCNCEFEKYIISKFSKKHCIINSILENLKCINLVNNNDINQYIKYN